MGPRVLYLDSVWLAFGFGLIFIFKANLQNFARGKLKMNKSPFGDVKTMDAADTSLGELVNDIDLVPRNEADAQDVDEECDSSSDEDSEESV